ncbi:M23 family metallopeptidase [Gloeothece verrucosa]|uniref:Peptidase M23 n=1 Tax=Gloeothece verrucosa (strain PCC 7822) TaxID=497965 RepID=E0UHQ2_GLOV7|nr:M23 family metallopeptidase [Gloeothece verrucosa]ADN13309.1 Peptidase M23 [Gloeothece verrucosa PCC 7822]
MNLELYVKDWTLLTPTLREIEIDEIKDIELIKSIQIHLNCCGYGCIVDGIVGEETKKVFARFKKEHFLEFPTKLGRMTAVTLIELNKTIKKGLFTPTKGEGWISSPYGQRGNSFHKGVDIACPQGTYVYAIASGVVRESVELCRVGDYNCGGGWGNHVMIEHSPEMSSRYAHLSWVSVKVGQQVKRGEMIGRSGNTGHSYGPHLHFEIIKNGERINPQSVMKVL